MKKLIALLIAVAFSFVIFGSIASTADAMKKKRTIRRHYKIVRLKKHHKILKKHHRKMKRAHKAR